MTTIKATCPTCGDVDLAPTDAVEDHWLLASLGPEPLGNAFNEAYLVAALRGRMTPIKAALLDAETGQLIVSCTSPDTELEIDFTVPARYAPSLQAGRGVKVRVDAYPERVCSAVVTAVDSRVDPNPRNVLLRARLREATGLLPGMFAVLEVDLGLQQQVVAIPETAMTYALQGNTVFVLEPTEDGQLTATAKVVRAGKVRDGRIAVLEGLNAGDRVVSVGQNKLYRGVRVIVDENVRL